MRASAYGAPPAKASGAPAALRVRGARVFDQGGSHGSCRYRFAAGAGTRMKSKKPKVAHEVLGKPLVRWWSMPPTLPASPRWQRWSAMPAKAGHPAGRGRHAGCGAGSAERHGGRGARLRRRFRRLRRLPVGAHRGHLRSRINHEHIDAGVNGRPRTHVEIRSPRSVRARRCRICPTSATPPWAPAST